MTELTFKELTQRISSLYHQKDYTQAYELATLHAGRFPEWSTRIYFWRACLASRMGNTDRPLDLLEGALEAGLWFFPDGFRQDPDLEPLQGLSRFERILEVCSERQAAARKQAKPQ